MNKEWFKKEYKPRFRLFCKKCNIFENGLLRFK